MSRRAGLTSGALEAIKIPIVLDSDRDALQVGLHTVGHSRDARVAVYPTRSSSNRGNAYINPLSLVGPDAARRGIVASFDCRNAGGDKPATDGPQGSPACETQKPYPFGGQLLRFPHVQREDYSKP